MKNFDQLDPTKQAQDLIEQNNKNKPGAWVDPYKGQYEGYLKQYTNREPFSYDYNADALYQQYKDQYVQQGKMARMDAVGQAAALTGGYGNSYAEGVGQQAYNQYLSQLNAVMPELYGMAADRYDQQGQDMLDKYTLYKGLSDQSYARHQDAMDNWYKEASQLTDNYNALIESQKEKSPEYASLSYDEQAKWAKEFSKAQSDEDLEWVADRMLAAGVDPKVVADWHDRYAKSFQDEEAPQVTGGADDTRNLTPMPILPPVRTRR